MVNAVVTFVLFALGSVVARSGNVEDNSRPRAASSSVPRFKNVIVLIPDGCDDATLHLSRLFKRENLMVDSMDRGSVITSMANSITTDSAPGGTAYACGIKSTDKFIGIGPRTEDLLSIFNPHDMKTPYAPYASVLEAAKMLRKSTGLLSTSALSHATPGAYSSHVLDRSMTLDITEQQVHQNIDVMMGGGAREIIPASDCPNAVAGGRRADCQNLMDELLDRGYEMCSTRSELMAITPAFGKKVWCNFASNHMQADINRKVFAQSEPSLAEMTQKAIEILSQNPMGFFLMVEGSEVDWAGHANDQIWMTTDFIAWDDAVKIAVDFAKADGETLVLALPDHNTGGMKVGNFIHEYVDMTPEYARDALLKMKVTSGGVVALMGVPESEATCDDLKKSVSENWGIELSDQDCEDILTYSETYSELFESNPGSVLPLGYGLSRIVSERYTYTGWTTHGHNSELVPMWVYGMAPPTGTIDNTDVAKIVAAAFGMDLDDVSMSLFVDLDHTSLSYEINVSDPKDRFATIGGFKFPINKDYFLMDGRRVMLPGVTVYAPVTNKVYVSMNAIEMVRSML